MESFLFIFMKNGGMQIVLNFNVLPMEQMEFGVVFVNKELLQVMRVLQSRL